LLLEIFIQKLFFFLVFYLALFRNTEARAVGVQGRKPLHVACDHDAPAVVVQALLKVYPEASTKVGTSRMNPLHITCSSQHASIPVIRVLLEGGIPSQTEMRDVDGDTPLHAACRCGAPMEVLEILLRANSQAVHERDYEGLTPLLRLWVRSFVILGDDVIDNVKGPGDINGELGEAWRKTEVLLKYAYHSLRDGQPSVTQTGIAGQTGTLHAGFRVVHAAAAVDCPRAVVKIATILYPSQVDELENDSGLSPLLIACKSPIFKVRDLSDEGYLFEDRVHSDDIPDGDENNQELEDEDNLPAEKPSVIEILLRASAESASVPDPKGRLPLHLALGSGKRWDQGIKDIISCFPDALAVVDPCTGLAPFQLAAEGSKTDLTTIFEIIRSSPSLLWLYSNVNKGALGKLKRSYWRTSMNESK
jgi:ankyrin repeat protein